MSYLLGLDISTTCIGWCVIKIADGSLFESGWIKLTNSKIKDSKFKKLNYAKDKLEEIVSDIKISDFAVEEAVKKFQGGKSTADVIMTVGSFNFGISYILFNRLNEVEPVYVSFTSARKAIGLKMPKKTDSKFKKELVRQEIEKIYPQIKWEKNKLGNIKAECYDMSDAILIGRVAWMTKYKQE